MNSSVRYPKARWFMLLTVFVGYLSVGMLTISFSPLIGLMMADLNIAAGTVSAASMATISLFSAISVIISGPIVDKFGMKSTTIIGASLMTLGTLLVPVLGSSIPGIVIIRLIQGLGFGPVSSSIPVMVARWFPPEEHGMANGLQGSGMAAGIAVGLILAPFSLKANHGDWKSAIAWLSILPIISLILYIITAFFKWPPVIETEEAKAFKESSMGHDFSLAIRRPIFYIGILVMFAFNWIMSAFNDLTPGYLAIDPPVGVGFGATIAGTSMTFVQIGMIIGAILSGFFLAKVFKGKYRITLVTAFTIIAITVFSMKFELIYGNTGLRYAVLFIAGFFEGFIIPIVTTFISTHYPPHLIGRVYGTSFGICLFGGSIGVSVGAAFLHTTGNYHASITTLAIVALIGIVLSLYMKWPAPKSKN